MRYGKLSVGVLLSLGLALPIATGGAENIVSASASARITLRLSSRAQLRQTDDPDTGQLCLSRIPADHYYLSVRDMRNQALEERRLAGRPGAYCVPLSASADGKMVLITAE